MNKEELARAIAETAKTAGQSSHGRSAYAELILETVEPNNLSLDLFSAFMPVRQANPGDAILKRIRRGRYPVFSMVPNTAHLVGQVSYNDVYQWTFDRLIAGARYSTWELRDNPLFTTQKIRTDLQNDLTDNLVGRVFSLLSTVWNDTNTPDNYAQGSEITKEVLDELIENVIEHTGNVRAIMGARRALLPIYDFAGFVEHTVTGGSAVAFDIPEVLLERYRTGRVASYHGIPLVETPQVYRMGYPNMEEKLIPEDKIVLIGENAGEILLYGGTESQDYTDLTIQPADYVLHMWQAYGMVIEDAENLAVFRRI